jgi:hypothetical protein
MTDKLQDKLRNSGDYTTYHIVMHSREAADRIDELEAILSEAVEGAWIDDEWELKARKALKAKEAETPERPSTDDQVPPREKYVPRASKAALFLLQADFQEHKRSTGKHRLWATEKIDTLWGELCSVRRRIEALERHTQTASHAPIVPHSCDAETIPSTPASHGSGDKTLEPLPEGWVHIPFEDHPKRHGEPMTTDRRSGKERRVSKSARTHSGNYFWHENAPFPNRRSISRRKSDRQEE